MSDKDSDKDRDREMELEWVDLQEKMRGRAHPREESMTSRMWTKTKDNPLVPIGICATTFCLTYGLICMRRGDSRKQQMMMRGRVMAQGFTVLALVSGIMYSLVNKAQD